MLAAPTALRMCTSHGDEAPAELDLSRLRLIACAGEPLDPEAHAWDQENLVGQSDGFVVGNCWQTEIAGAVLGTLPTFEARPGRVGTPMPGVVGSLEDHVREDLGPIADPSETVFRDALPKTRSGKIARRLLRAEALGEDPGGLSTLADRAGREEGAIARIAPSPTSASGRAGVVGKGLAEHYPPMFAGIRE